MTGTRSMFWAGILTVAIATPTLWSAPPEPTAVAAEHASTAKPRSRLPNNYGKLGVTTEQRSKIYAIQADYDGRIDDLQAQIEALRTQRNAALESALNPGQRVKLQEIQQERLAKRQPAANDGTK